MTIDTSGLFGWCSPVAVGSAAPAVKRGAEAYLDCVEQAKGTWQQLGSHYSGDGAAEVSAAFENVMPNARMLEDLAGAVSGALIEFANRICTLEARRTSLLTRVREAEARAAHELEMCAAGSDYDPSPAGTAELLLPAEVSALAAQYLVLEEETAAKLRSAFRGDGGFLGAATGIPATVLYGIATTAMNAATLRQTVRQGSKAIVPLYRRYKTAVQRMRMGRGRGITELKAAAVFGFDLRPKVSENLYNRSDRYRSRVNANPAGWVMPERFKDLGAAVKGIKIGGGGILSVLSAGLTIASEREVAYNELLQSNPGWSREELDRRANLEGGVKGGTKAGIDVGAAAVGALIGTAIGGPAGTLVGAGIGIGISVATSVEFEFLGDRSIKDAFADHAMKWIDGIAERWGKLFGR